MLASVIDATKRKSSDAMLMFDFVAIAIVGAVINANPSSMKRAGCIRPGGSVVAAVSSPLDGRIAASASAAYAIGIARVERTLRSNVSSSSGIAVHSRSRIRVPVKNSEEQERRCTAPARGQDQPDDRGEDQDVGEGIGTPDAASSRVASLVVGTTRNAQVAIAAGDRERDAVEQAFAVSARRSEGEDAHDSGREQGISDEVEDVGERDRRPVPAEVRIRVPEQVADDPAGEAAGDQPPGQPIVLGASSSRTR